MSTYRVTALAAAAGLAALLTACGPSSAPELVAQAREAMEAKDAKAAQIHLKNALQKDPQSADARFLLGKLLLEAGDAQGALVEFGKAESAGFRGPELAPLHAKALLERREYRKLIDAYKAVQLPDAEAHARVNVFVAQAQARLGHAADAKAILEAVLAKQPGQPQADAELARLEAQEGRMDAALARIDGLLQRAPQEAAAWRLKGDLEMAHRKDSAAALKAYQQAVAADPKSVENHVAVIAHQLSARDLSGAEEQLKQAKTQVGSPHALRFYAAVVDMEQGRLDAAAEQAQQLLKVAPDDVRVLMLAGQTEYLRDHFLQAEAHLVRALGHPGSPLRARLLLAQTYLRLDDAARTLQTLQPLLEDPGKLDRVHALAGEAYLQLGETRRAEEQFKLAAKLNPKDMRSRAMVAMGQLGRGEDARGLAELRDLSDSFESPVADLALVNTFIRKGDHASALEAIAAIDRKTPAKGLAPMLKAQVLISQGKRPDADAALAEALKRDPKYLPAALMQARLDLKEKNAAQAVKRVAAVAQADPDNVVTQLAWFNVRVQAAESLDAIESELKALVQKQPQVARARQALVGLQMRRGDLAAAALSAQQAVTALPTEAGLVELLADVQLRQREYTLASKTLEQLAQLRPRSPEPLLRIAEVDLARQQPREALNAVRKAIAIKANHGPALRQQVLLEAELGNVEAARRYVKDMAALPGLEAQAAAVEGDLETAQQQYGVAVSAFRRALSRNAALPDVPAKLHRVLRGAGQQSEADAFAQGWFKDHPLDVSFMNYLGDVALNDRQLASARAHYERSLGIKAEQAAVLNNLAFIAQHQNDLKRAEQLARDAVRLAPGDGLVHDTLSAVQSALGQHDAAVTTQQRAVALATDASLRVGLARRLLAAGRKDKAKDELESVQKLGDRYRGQSEVTELLKSL